MLKDSSDNQDKNSYSETTKKNIICKDGFCSLPNQNDISKQEQNDMNLFDPI